MVFNHITHAMIKRRSTCDCTPESKNKRAKLIHDHWLTLSSKVDPEEVSWQLGNGQEIKMLKLFSRSIEYDLTEDNDLRMLLKENNEDLVEKSTQKTPYKMSGQVFAPVDGLPNCKGEVVNFQTLTNGHYAFVDKSRTIEYLINHTLRCFLIARPPRFGKTITLSMFDNFYNKKKQNSSDLFKHMLVSPPTKSAHQQKYTVFSLDLLLIDAQISTFKTSLKSLMLAALKECDENYYDSSLELMDIIPHVIKKSEGKVIILLDNFDVPFLNFRNDSGFEFVASTMRQAFGKLSDTQTFRLAVATCVVPEQYSIAFQHIDYSIRSQFFRCFGFENLEVYLLLQVMNSYKGVTFLELEKFISLYGNYYYAANIEDNANDLLWKHDPTMEDSNESDSGEQHKSGALCNPAWVMEHLHLKNEAKENFKSQAVQLLAKLVKEEKNTINWQLVSLQAQGCVHIENNLIELDIHPSQARENTIHTLLIHTGLAQHFICGHKFGKPEERGEHYILLTPNKTARKTLRHSTFECKLLLQASTEFAAGFENNDIKSIFNGIEECLNLTNPRELPWNANESAYKLVLIPAFRSATAVQVEPEYTTDSGTSIDVFVSPRMQSTDKTVYVIEFKKLKNAEAAKIKNWSSGTYPAEIFGFLKKTAQICFQQILDHKYHKLKARLINKYTEFICESLTLISVAFFKREFVLCYATVSATEELTEVTVKFLTTLPMLIHSLKDEKMKVTKYDATQGI